jgi:DNA-binding protein H-NS
MVNASPTTSETPPSTAKALKGEGSPAPKSDTAQLADEELRALISRAEEELAARRKRRQEDFFTHVREQAEKLGIDPADIAAALGKKGNRAANDRRAVVAPKYRNPGNPKQTWAGRGAPPKWLQQRLDAGAELEDFRIADAVR